MDNSFAVIGLGKFGRSVAIEQIPVLTFSPLILIRNVFIPLLIL